MNDSKVIRLNIGAGQNIIPGYVNIDISNRADITLDLGKDKLPYANDTVDLIFSYHTLEHIPDYLFALSEIYRVLKHDGLFLVGLPYVTSTEFHLINPYHLHNFNEYSFDFFDPEKLKGSAVEDNPIKFKKVFCRFQYIGVFNLLPSPLKSWCRRHLFNVVRKIDYGLTAVKSTNAPSTTTCYSKKDIIQQFDTCLYSRIRYHKYESGRTNRIPPLSKRLERWWHGHGWRSK